MKQPISRLLFLVLLILPASFTGCTNSTPPDRVAYNVADATFSTVDSAMDAWVIWVWSKRDQIVLLKNDAVAAEKSGDLALHDRKLGEALAMQSQLLIDESKVSAALDRYQQASKAAIAIAATASSATNNMPSISAAVSVAASEVISTVRSIARK